MYVQLNSYVYQYLCIVRLVNGSTYEGIEGRVEVYYNGEWDTVCDDGWDLIDAQVVCRQLGFGAAVAATDSAIFGKGSGQNLLKYLSCLGTELSIEDCSHDGWGVEDCSHGEDAGVRCAASNGNFIYL